MRQILTEIFDYIRIINARDPLLDPFHGSAFAPANSIAGNIPYSSYESIQTYSTNGFSQGQILPTYNSTWGTDGYGRSSHIVVGATLDFVAVGKGLTNTDTVYTNSPPNYFPVATNQATTSAYTGQSVPPAPVMYVPAPYTTAVQAVFTVTLFHPALGFSWDSSSMTVTVSGLNTLKLNGGGLFFPASGTIIHQGVGSWNGALVGAGGTKSGYDTLFQGQFKSSGGYPFWSYIKDVPSSGTSPSMMLGNGGLITIKVYPLTTTATPPGPVHTYTMDLSLISATTNNLPVPTYGPRCVFGSIRSGPIGSWTNYVSDRFDYSSSGGNDSHGEAISLPIDTFDDTVISMVPSTAYGDYRMLADTNVPSSAFVAHPNYSVGNRLAYSQEAPEGQLGRGASGNTHCQCHLLPGNSVRCEPGSAGVHSHGARDGNKPHGGQYGQWREWSSA